MGNLHLKISLKMAERELQSNIKEYLFTNNLVKPLLFFKFSPSDKRIKRILMTKGYYSTIGTTRPYRDLIIWKEQTEQEYIVRLPEGKQKVKVVFMGNFVCNGWIEYATMGKSSAGGWATKDAIYCLKSYDVSSENFRVSLLVHEGQHFTDYQSFPKLRQADLEYRAKLAELSKAELFIA